MDEPLSYIAQAENSLAGCLLVDPEHTAKAIRGLCAADDFQNEQASAVYTVSLYLLGAGKPCDPVTIQAEAAARGISLDTAYCAELMRLYTTTANAAETARILHAEGMKRRARTVGHELIAGKLDAVGAAVQLQALIREQGSRILSPLEAANAVMDELVAAADGTNKVFLPTGIDDLDAQLGGGLVAGGMITLAARPGTGKSTVALNIAENVAATGKPVLYVSLEMGLSQVWACRAANASGLSRSNIYAGTVPDQEWGRLTDAFDLLSRRPLYVRDRPSSVDDIEREARCIDGLALVVVDHLGLVRAAQRGSRYEVMTDTSHRIKQLALSLKIPILSLCQLNRQSEARESKRPTMADLRDSGAIEEDSDVVGLLYRPAQYFPDEGKPKPWESQELDVLIEKNRHAPTGGVKLSFCGMTARITEGRAAS